MPVDTSNLTASEMGDFFNLQDVLCVYWKAEGVGASSVDFGQWSNYGCKATAVSRQRDASGNEISDKGLVTCKCNHLTNFAVAFGQAKVRFLQVPGTPRPGDLYQVQSGSRVHFEVDIVDELGLGGRVGEPHLMPYVPHGRSFSDPHFEPGHPHHGATDAYSFEWTPRDPGDYVVEIDLFVGQELIDIRIFYVRVLFCEDYLLAGETLQDVAFRNRLPWQALFAINPGIQNPRNMKAKPAGRTWICVDGDCNLAGDLPGARVNIGRRYTVQQGDTLFSIVNGFGSSFTQLARYNTKRLEAVLDGEAVFDIAHRHNATGSEVSYVGEEFCVVSRLADGCVV